MTCRRHRAAARMPIAEKVFVTDEDRKRAEEKRKLYAAPCTSVWEGVQVRCGLRVGHDGDHQSGPFKWDDEHAAEHKSEMGEGQR